MKTKIEGFDKICELYVKEQAFWIMSGRSEKEIEARKVNFMTAYAKEIDQFCTKNEKDISKEDVLDAELKKLGYTQDELMLAKDFRKVKGDHKDFQVKAADKKEEALREFHKWIYRNADKAGFEFLGSKGSHREYLEHNFMIADREIQKRTLFYLEKDVRKLNDADRKVMVGGDDYKKYTPEYENIKTIMHGTWMKFWKRQDGSYLYWNKLKDAFGKARSDYHDEIVAAGKPVHGDTKTAAGMGLNKEFFDDTNNWAMLDKCAISGMNLKNGTGYKGTLSNIALGEDPSIPADDQPYNGKILTYNGVTDSLTSAFKMVATVKGTYDSFKEAKDSWGDKSDLGTTADLSNGTMNLGFAVNGGATFSKGVCNVVTAATKTEKMITEGVKVTAEGVGKVAGTVAGWAVLIASCFKTIAGFVESLKFWKGKSHAKEAAENARQMKQEAENNKNPDPEAKVRDKEAREAEATKLENRAAFMEKANKRKFLGSALPKIIAGALGIAAGVISVFTLGVAPAVAAGIGLATGIFFFLGEKLAGMWPSRTNKREAVDAELLNKGTASGKEKEFAKRRNEMYQTLEKDPARVNVKKYIEKKMNVTINEEGKSALSSKKFHRHIGNIDRRNIEADNGLMNHDEAYTYIKGKIGEEALDKVYGSKTADGVLKNGMTAAEFNANKEILRSLGVKSKKYETADRKDSDKKIKAFNDAKHVAAIAC